MIGWSADFKELAETALSDWPDLTESELKLLCAVTSGQIAYCGPSLSDDDPLNDPRLAASWGNERCIRAPLILALCLDPGATGYIELAGIRIHAARIEGDLDLRSAKISFPLALLRCQIKNRPDLTMAQVESLNLSGSVTPGLLAGQITVCGSLDMASGFLSEGAVFLDGTSVGGNLNCSAGRFTTGANPLEAGMPYGAVLFAPGLRVSGVVFLSGGFCAEGSVVLTGAEIGGQLTCDEGNFVNPGGRALIADALTVGGAAFFRGARASGELRLNGARVRVLECARGRFVNPGGYALNADGIRVEGSVRLGRFYTQGEVCFVGASVGGSLECDSGHFTNPGRISLNCDHFRVDRSVYLRAAVSTGEVRLLGGIVGESLECQGASFLNADGHAIEADRLNVAGDVKLSLRFTAVGALHFRGAEIGGNLECKGATFIRGLKEVEHTRCRWNHNRW